LYYITLISYQSHRVIYHITSITVYYTLSHDIPQTPVPNQLNSLSAPYLIPFQSRTWQSSSSTQQGHTPPCLTWKDTQSVRPSVRRHVYKLHHATRTSGAAIKRPSPGRQFATHQTTSLKMEVLRCAPCVLLLFLKLVSNISRAAAGYFNNQY